MKGFRREDDYLSRRESIANLSDEELKDRFWDNIEKIVDPLLDQAYKYTSPSIERSILLRMGFSSLEAKPLVEMAIDHGMIKHGVGHVVYLVSKKLDLPIRDAGMKLIEGEYWDLVKEELGGK
ncbi:MAG TPA: ornithine aminomutase subunit alpha [Clostridia bacterium]|nr:ornithine aminomutase subunit alpha [Clostridia bacterium]